MQPAHPHFIRGTWATLLLPLDAVGSIEWHQLTDEIDCLLESGVDGIYSNGTAGEFYAQTENEFARIQELLASRCHRARMPFQIGASHPCAHTCLDRVRAARQHRPTAIQIILPDWRPLSAAETLRFLTGVAEAAAEVPLVLYHPPHVKRLLTPVELARLAADVPSLIGVKVGTADPEWIGALRAAAPSFSIFVPGQSLASGVGAGADGSYSNIACLNPSGAKRWNGLICSNLTAALKLEQRVKAFFAAHIGPLATQYAVANHAIDKFLAAVGGWIDIHPRLRWPYDGLPIAEAHRLRQVAQEELPELF